MKGAKCTTMNVCMPAVSYAPFNSTSDQYIQAPRLCRCYREHQAHLAPVDSLYSAAPRDSRADLYVITATVWIFG